MKERSHKTQAKLTALQQKQNVVLANSDINFTEKVCDHSLSGIATLTLSVC